MALTVTPIYGIPEINPGDNIAEIILKRLSAQKIDLLKNDIIVITQKIISKAENRYVNLSTIRPSKKALEISKISGKKPELVEIILKESKKLLRVTNRTIITVHKLGFVSANAGIDHSNVWRDEGNPRDWYLLLPKNPDKTAKKIRGFINNEKKVKIGIMIIDSHGRAWRYGTVGTMIGTAGVPALKDLRGKSDLYGYKLKITRVGTADELAGAASLVMGQANESIPAVHIRGFPYSLRESCLSEVLRPENKDLFR